MTLKLKTVATYSLFVMLHLQDNVNLCVCACVCVCMCVCVLGISNFFNSLIKTTLTTNKVAKSPKNYNLY